MGSLGSSGPGGKGVVSRTPRVKKAHRLSNVPSGSEAPEETLARPEKALVPSLGASCGRREREADAGENGEEVILSLPLGRDGGRHPGSRDIGNLRGWSGEREPRSVRSCVEVSSSTRGPTDDKRVSSGSRRRGTSSAYASKRTHSTRRPPRRRSSRTRPSLGPETRARQSPLDSLRSKAGRGGAVDWRSRSGKPG